MPRAPRAKKTSSSSKIDALPQMQVVEKIVEKTIIVDKADLEAQAQRNREATLLDPTPASVFAAAQTLVEQEKQKYEDSSFNMRETLKRVYKNYLGIFDQPYDKNTGRKKIFTPLTHNAIDGLSKPVTIESEAIQVHPVTDESRGAAKVISMLIPHFFQEMNIRQLMKKFSHYLTLLGTQVTVQDWLYEEIEVADDADPTMQILTARGFVRKEKKKDKLRIVKTDKPRISLVNLLDLYVPFTAESLAWACKNASVILRSVQTVDQIQANPLYDDEAKASLRGSTYSRNDTKNGDSLDQYNTAGYVGFSPTAKTGGQQDFYRQERPFTEIYERYGMVPKSWITFKVEDAMQFIPAIITCAADSSGGSFKTLSVRLSPFGAEGPFEEAWFNKLPNRWYGEGLGERLVPLQIWQNEIVNNRRNNEVMTQNNMFIYKKGSVNPNDFRSRPAGGIAVTNMNDVEPIRFGDIAGSSFQEDSYLDNLAQKMAGITQPTGVRMSAFQAANIQAMNNLTYNELRESLENYLSRVFNNHIIPLLRRYFTGPITVPIKMSSAETILMDTLNGYEPFVSDMLGRERFLLVEDSKVFDGHYAIVADIEAVAANRATKVQALSQAIAMAMKMQNSGMNMGNAFRVLMEMSGVRDDRLFDNPQAPTSSGITNPNPIAGGAPPVGAPAIPGGPVAPGSASGGPTPPAIPASMQPAMAH